MREHQEYLSSSLRAVTEGVVPLYAGHVSEARVTTPTILCLVLGPAERARIRESTRGRRDVIFVERIADVDRLLAKSQCAPSALIVEVRDRDGRGTCELVRRLAAAKPLIPIVAYVRSDSHGSGEIRELIVAGVHGLMFFGIDDSGMALRAAIEGAQQTLVGQRASDGLMQLLSERVWSFVRHVSPIV